MGLFFLCVNPEDETVNLSRTLGNKSSVWVGGAYSLFPVNHSNLSQLCMKKMAGSAFLVGVGGHIGEENGNKY